MTSTTRRRPSRSEGPSQWSALRDAERIRWSRVLSAQARIAADYYDRDDVKEFLVDAVIDELARH
jgi:hypothetical protein